MFGFDEAVQRHGVALGRRARHVAPLGQVVALQLRVILKMNPVSVLKTILDYLYGRAAKSRRIMSCW